MTNLCGIVSKEPEDRRLSEEKDQAVGAFLSRPAGIRLRPAFCAVGSAHRITQSSLLHKCSRGSAQREELKIQPDPTAAALDRRSGHQVAAEEPMVLFLA
jgi:hypothetical protein